MLRTALAVALLSLTTPALARPGFYVVVGGGGAGVSGENRLPESRFGPDDNGLPLEYNPGFAGLSTDNGGGLAGLVRVGFNVLGYAAIEAVASGHGADLTDSDTRQWAAHSHLGVRAYPLWHWQSQLPPELQPLEPSIFVGWGVSYQSYIPVPTADPVGWEDWGSLRVGLGLEYFIIENFKVGFDWDYIRASYGRFIYNADEGIDFPVEPAVTTGYNEFFVTVGFQVGATQKTVRYEPPPATEGPVVPAAPEPTPAPAPAAPPVIDG